MKIRIISALILFSLSIQLFAQNIDIHKVEPPFWWIGMKNPAVQLLVHGENISLTQPELKHKGVVISNYTTIENPNYLIIDLEIAANAKPGEFDIVFKNGRKAASKYSYQLLEREPGSAQRKGFDESDLIYLVLPDRFVNADPSNDSPDAMLEKSLRNIPDSRHGGDLQGVIDKLDYMEDIGVTALWLNPVLENNQPTYSYHGYAITDFYKVDARFGSNEDFKKLSTLLHDRNMKAVMDMVFNHCGSSHWWMDDLPSQDWIHQFPEFTRSNFRGGTIFDPYASEIDQRIFQQGWFDKNMPDLNQRNQYLNNYLIQNSIWWIEYAGLDGIRMDTYPYPYKEQMAEWAQRVVAEYPNFTMVGEVWMGQAALVAPWESESGVKTDYSSHLPYVFDFPMYDAFEKAFNEDAGGWDAGLMRLYDVLTQDFLYGEDARLLVFPDNHDGNRLFTKLNENVNSQKLALTFLLTTRGVPQVYYGTEILMTGEGSNGHGKMRKDFPGGWASDSLDKFKASDRSMDENDAFDHFTTLANWRKNKTVIHHGKLKHFIPENNLYVYFRYDESELVMVVMNNLNKAQTLDHQRFSEVIDGKSSGKNILDGKTYQLNDLQIPAKSSLVLELN